MDWWLHTGLYRDRGVMETKVTSGKLKCLEWRKSDLIDLVEKNTRILAAFDAALSIDELEKTYSAWENARRTTDASKWTLTMTCKCTTRS